MGRKPWHRGAEWQKARKRVLERDGHRCMIRGDGCTGEATEVDHIVSPQPGPNGEPGGAWFDDANLRAACAHCNRSRGGKLGARRRDAGLIPPPSRRW